MRTDRFLNIPDGGSPLGLELFARLNDLQLIGPFSFPESWGRASLHGRSVRKRTCSATSVSRQNG